MTALHTSTHDTVARLACPAELASLPALLALVAAACRREQVDDATAHALKLIAEEACVNVMHYAYPAGQPGPLTLQVATVRQHGHRRIVLVLEDLGKPFNPLSLPPPDANAPAEARVPGGLGVHLIRQLSERQHYERHPQRGNVFTIEKFLATARPH